MFTSIDKALVAAILGFLSIVNVLWGVDLFGWGVHTQQTLEVIISVLLPILVWLVPNAGANR